MFSIGLAFREVEMCDAEGVTKHVVGLVMTRRVKKIAIIGDFIVVTTVGI